MKFDMSIDDNYASFIDESSGRAMFVDSFDNKEFEVRIGTITESEFVKTVTASSSDELNQKLETLFFSHQEDKS